MNDWDIMEINTMLLEYDAQLGIAFKFYNGREYIIAIPVPIAARELSKKFEGVTTVLQEWVEQQQVSANLPL